MVDEEHNIQLESPLFIGYHRACCDYPECDDVFTDELTTSELNGDLRNCPFCFSFIFIGHRRGAMNCPTCNGGFLILDDQPLKKLKKGKYDFSGGGL